MCFIIAFNSLWIGIFFDNVHIDATLKTRNI